MLGYRQPYRALRGAVGRVAIGIERPPDWYGGEAAELVHLGRPQAVVQVEDDHGGKVRIGFRLVPMGGMEVVPTLHCSGGGSGAASGSKYFLNNRTFFGVLVRMTGK